jgi:hypothetical protein
MIFFNSALPLFRAHTFAGFPEILMAIKTVINPDSFSINSLLFFYAPAAAQGTARV